MNFGEGGLARNLSVYASTVLYYGLIVLTWSVKKNSKLTSILGFGEGFKKYKINF
jgi:hypothetical protein